MDNLTFITRWFKDQCDGEWESDFGLTIESVNNPGWMVRIDLDGTGLEPATFKPLADQRSDTDWVEARVDDGAWVGGASVQNLDELLGVFRAWVEQTPRPRGAAHKSAHSHPAPDGPPHGPRGNDRRPSGPRPPGRGNGPHPGGGKKPFGKKFRPR